MFNLYYPASSDKAKTNYIGKSSFVKCYNCKNKPATIRCFTCQNNECEPYKKLCYNCDKNVHSSSKKIHERDVIHYSGIRKLIILIEIFVDSGSKRKDSHSKEKNLSEKLIDLSSIQGKKYTINNWKFNTDRYEKDIFPFDSIKGRNGAKGDSSVNKNNERNSINSLIKKINVNNVNNIHNFSETFDASNKKNSDKIELIENNDKKNREIKKQEIIKKLSDLNEKLNLNPVEEHKGNSNKNEKITAQKLRFLKSDYSSTNKNETTTNKKNNYQPNFHNKTDFFFKKDNINNISKKDEINVVKSEDEKENIDKILNEVKKEIVSPELKLKIKPLENMLKDVTKKLEHKEVQHTEEILELKKEIKELREELKLCKKINEKKSNKKEVFLKSIKLVGKKEK